MAYSQGSVVAPSKATEFVIDQNKLDNSSLKSYLEKHAKLFEREGAHLGGWLKKQTGEYMLDVVFPLSYEDAVRHAMWGDQDAIFDLSTFNEIATRDETTQQVKPPEGFQESLNQILKQKPSDIGSAAERSFRESSPIRDQSIESIRRRAEGSQGEVRQPPPSKTRGTEVDENLFLPINYEQEYRKKYSENAPRRRGGYLTTVNNDGNEVSPLSIREGQETLRGGKQDGSIDLVRFTHFPNQKIRHSILEVSKHGSGIPGAEARRKRNFPQAYVDRIYFGDSNYIPERGLETDFPHVVDVDEHAFMARFTEIFKEEFERMTGDTLDPSALQATRWFFMIDTAKRLGYSKAATNETISGYTQRYLSKLGSNQGSGGQSDGTPNAGVSSPTQDQGRQLLPQGERVNRVFRKPPRANRFMMAPAARAAVTSGEMDRFRQ